MSVFQVLGKRIAALLAGALLALGAAGQTVTYIHNDPAGSPLLATNASGSVVWKENYTPHGDRRLKQPASGNSRLWFTGRPQEGAAGLLYLGARYYDPVLGRFMGVDPKGVDPQEVHGINRYAYANNNPGRYVDPDGHSPLDVAFLVYDLGKLGHALYSGSGVAAAGVDVALSVVGVASPLPGVGQALKAARAVDRGVDAARGVGRSVEAVGAAKGTLEGANYAQKTFGSMFSKGGAFAGRSVDDVAGALRSGAMKPSEIPIDFIVRDGNRLILNTRSAQALEAASIPRSQWNAVNRTGQEMFENMLSGQLQRNGLTSEGIANVRRSGGF